MLQQGSITAAMSHQSNVAQVSLEVYNNFFFIHFWIRSTFWFRAGSWIIDNNLRGCLFLFLTLWGPILIPFLTLRGKANIYLT